MPVMRPRPAGPWQTPPLPFGLRRWGRWPGPDSCEWPTSSPPGDDHEPVVRARAAEVTAVLGPVAARVALRALADPDARVVEAGCFALGEIGQGGVSTVTTLSDVGRDHPDPLCREAAVAALGAIGDPGGLPAILHATTDKPAVRRRAVLALAPFEGPEVDAALERALTGPRLAGPPGGRGSGRQPPHYMKRSFTASNSSRHLPGPEHHAFERRIDQDHGDAGLLLQSQLEPAEHPASAHEVDALGDQVLGQLGR